MRQLSLDHRGVYISELLELLEKWAASGLQKSLAYIDYLDSAFEWVENVFELNLPQWSLFR